MVEDAKTRASSVTEGKMARGCDACTGGSNASWYCPADDAFLCQRCDASIHSANELAKRHERVRLQSSSSPVKKTSVWYEGFTRKARTPRNKGLRHGKLSQIDSTDPLVPDLGGEEEDGFLSFSSTDENDESLNYLVPVFDPFSDMLIDDINSFDLIPDGDTITTNGGDMEEIMGGDGLSGILPLDLDLAGLNMDVESLLKEEEQPCLGVKEEGDLGFELNCKGLSSVKDEVDVEQKRETGKEFVDEDRNKSLFLRLDYESVIGAWGSHGTPWKTETKPEFKSGDSLQGAQRTYPSHVLGKDAAVGCATRQQGRGGSDGDREARVLRYKEKRRTRLFAKKIRYEVRKLNAEQRPRIKGRFVKRSSL